MVAVYSFVYSTYYFKVDQQNLMYSHTAHLLAIYSLKHDDYNTIGAEVF